MSGQDVSLKLQEVFRAILGSNSIDPVNMTQENSSQWDSLAHINIITATEEEFGLVFKDAEIQNIRSFADILKIVEQRGNGQLARSEATGSTPSA